MIDPVWAQTPGGGAAPIVLNALPLLMIIVVFYFLLIRPQQQKAKEHRALLENLKRNDEVITAGGLYGKVTALTDQIVTLEVAPNVRVRVSRQQVTSVATTPRAEEKDKGKDGPK